MVRVATLPSPSPRAQLLGRLPTPRGDAEAAAQVATALQALREHGEADVTVAHHALGVLTRAAHATCAWIVPAVQSGALHTILSVLRAHDDISLHSMACAITLILLREGKDVCTHGALLEAAAAAAAALRFAAQGDALPTLVALASRLVVQVFTPVEFDEESVARRDYAAQLELPKLLNDTLTPYVAQADVVLFAAALRSVVDGSPAGRATAARGGALRNLTAVLRAHADDECVVRTVAEAVVVCTAGCADEIRQPVVSDAALSVLVDAMQRHPTEMMVQVLCGAAIGNIGGTDARVQAAAVTAGAVEVVVAALTRFSGEDNWQTQNELLTALSNLVFDSEENGKRAVAAGAQPHILHALSHCGALAHSATRFAPIICTLAYTCVTHEACEAALAAGAVRVVCGVLMQVRASANEEEVRLVKWACIALGAIAGPARLNDSPALAATAARRAACGEQGGVAAALAVLRAHASNNELQCVALSVLMALCHGDERNSRAALAAGAVADISLLLDACPGDHLMMCVALGTLLVMREAVQPATARVPFATAAEVIAAGTVRAMVTHPDVEVVFQAGPRVLLYVALTDESSSACADMVVRNNALEVVTAALRRRAFESNGFTWEGMWGCVCYLIKAGDASAAARARRAGLLPILQAECTKQGESAELLPVFNATVQILKAAPRDGADVPMACANPGCGATARADGSGKQLSLCAGSCGTARYCGPACQRLDWARHKMECKLPRSGQR